MKRFFLLCGPMGVGKSTVGRALRDRLENCAFLDGDWCWDMHPFRVTPVTRRVVLDNICHSLDNFLTCGAFENVVFCWVMPQREILDGILARLHTQMWQTLPLALVCTRTALEERLRRDIAAGVRAEDVVACAVAYLPRYAEMGLPTLDVSRLSAAEAAEQIERMCR